MMHPQNKKLTLTVTVNGRKTEDLIDALQLILREVEEGHIQGFNCNYTGDYHYDVKEDHNLVVTETDEEPLAA